MSDEAKVDLSGTGLVQLETEVTTSGHKYVLGYWGLPPASEDGSEDAIMGMDVEPVEGVEVPGAIHALIRAHLAAGAESVHDAWTNILGVLRSAQDNGVKSVGKAGVAKAEGEEEVAKAVASAQSDAPLYLVGSGRRGGGRKSETGLTAKERTALGTAVVMEQIRTGKPPSQARLREIMLELGIDPDKLGAA